MSENASVTLPGRVQKIIPSPILGEPAKAEIRVESAEHLYREVRIENRLTTESGDEISLKVGSPVEVTITAEAESTTVQSSLPESTKR